MASIITSISLDAETLEIKNRVIANYGFSRWIRECLREADAQSNPTHTTEEDARIGGRCNGMAKPACVICWPLGAPSHNDWIAYREEARFVAFPQEPSAEKPRIVKATLADGETQSEGKKTTTRHRSKKGLIRRFIAWLY